MFQFSTLNTKIIFFTIGTGICFGLFFIYSIFVTTQNATLLESTVNVYYPALENANRNNIRLDKLIEIFNFAVTANEFDSLKNAEIIANEFRSSLNDLSTLNEEYADYATTLREQFENYFKAAYDLANKLINSADPVKQEKQLINDMHQHLKTVRDSISRLNDVSRSDFTDAIVTANQSATAIVFVGILIGILALLFSISIYLIFRFKVLTPIKKLTNGATAISKGNLDNNVLIESNDEFGHLAEVFNHMTQSLKKNYSELQTMNSNLIAATKAKSEFLANMSHEIRTPLTSIIGFSEKLRDAGAVATDKLSMINVVIKNGRHLERIINDLLDISKIEANKITIDLEKYPLFDLIQDIEQIIGLQTRVKNLDLVMNYQYPLPEEIVTDALRLKQVLINICSNAVKFTEKGFVSVDISCNKQNETLVFRIKDTGIGLTSDDIKRIFDPFAQADASTTRRYGGTGLGLSISKKLIDMLGGEIKAEGLVGCGSCFTVTISTGPLDYIRFIKNREQLSITKERNPPAADFRHDLSGKVLLVEDTLENQMLIKAFLEDTQILLDIVDNGKQAVDRLKTHQYDLILMDMQMPVMSGIDASKIIRSSGNYTPIVALTANAMKEDQAQYNEIGCNGFISKPFSIDSFYESLQPFLGKSRKTA